MAPSPPSRGRLTTIAQVLGVILGAWLFWTCAVQPQLGRQSLASLIGESLFYVTLAWACGTIVTFCIYIVVALADLPDAIQFSMRSSAPAMWFAPSLILLSMPAVAAVAVSLVIVVNTTRLLISQWAMIELPMPQAQPAAAGDSFLFGLPEEAGFLSGGWASVLMGSCMAQAGLVALLWHRPMLAATCLATSAAILTALSIFTGAYRPVKPPTLPPSLLSIAVTFLLAAALSLGGMAVHRGGWASSGTPANNSADSGNQPAPSVVTTVAPPEQGSEIGGGFPGVILLPEVNRQTTLFVPVPVSPLISGVALPRPVGIPFSGEYWMFKPPRTRPPLRSIVRHGKPTEISFHTTDGDLMEMEAHQRMDPAIDVRCCSRIELTIANTDHYPGTVSLELILGASETAGGRWQSLGSEFAGSGSALRQTLTYPMTPAAALGKFDEFKVVFHRSLMRGDKSARIAIERFILVP